MYFQLLPDMSGRQRITRWAEFADGTPLPGPSFVRGTVYDRPEPVYLPVADPGPDVDFSFGYRHMAVVRRPLAEAIVQLAPDDIQAVDAVIGDDDTNFVILNPIRLVDCIDESGSVTTPLVDEQRAFGRTGKYSMVAIVHLLYDRVDNAQFFRLSEWPMALIGSERVVNVLKQFEVTGVRWEEA